MVNPERMSPPIELPPEEGTEELAAYLDARLEECLERFGHRINEGNNGVIFGLDLKEAPRQTTEALDALGVDSRKEQAVKILKIYQAGAGQHEYEMQQAAYEAVTSAENKDLAQIPQAHLYRDLELTSETQEYLSQRAPRAALGKRVEMIVMDLVPGADLATILYREALQRLLPEVYPTIDDLRNMDWSEALSQIAGRLDFRDPGKKGTTEAEQAFEQGKVAMDNANKLLTHLKKSGFVLHPGILSKIKNTVDLLHNSGLAHRDLHERNIMISGDYEYAPDKPAPDVYLIDFGTATTFSGKYQPGRNDIYSSPEQEKQFADDDRVARFYQPLSETQEAKKERVQQESANEVERKIAQLKNDANYQKAHEAWVAYFAKNPDINAALETLFARMVAGKSQQEVIVRFLGIVDTVVKNGTLDSQTVKSFILRQSPTAYQKQLVNAWKP